jgi:protein-tyrosine phosphatase
VIDLHSHILAGIDDGAKDLDNSLAMAFQAVECGVTKMVCTPHIQQGYYDNNLASIKQAFDRLTAKLAVAKCPLKIAFSAEVRIGIEITNWIKKDQIPFIGEWQGRNAMLLELPHSHVPPGSENLLRWLLANQVQPIIVHPERNRDIISDYSKLISLKQAGAIFQVTAGSFCGRFSDKVKETAMQLLEDDNVSFIASDTHNTDRRPNEMGACRDILLPLVGEQKTFLMLKDTPDLITQNLLWQ